MRKRTILLTVLIATGLAVTESRHVCAVAVVRSAQAFDQYFQALRQEPLNPVERVMFSLVLANAKDRHAPKPLVHS
jgi:hypothetical protein